MKALVIGAGRVGASVAYRLRNLDLDVTVWDIDEAALKNPLLKECTCVHIKGSTGFVKREVDYIINCGPWHMNADLMRAAVNARAHYFDLSEDERSIQLAQDLARGHGEIGVHTAIVPACGLAPGFVSIMANSMARRWHKVDTIKIYVGALPLAPPHNSIHHELTFSAEGLVNEYTKGIEVLSEGSVKRAKPLIGHENLNIGGVDFEAFTTAGGLGTLAQTWEGRADFAVYKTLRYRGHLAAVKGLIQLMPGQGDLIRAFRRLPRAQPGYDMVVAKIRVEGQWGFDVWERTYTNAHTEELTVAKMTAASVCAMVQLHIDHKIPGRGFVPVESVSIDDFLATESGSVFS